MRRIVIVSLSIDRRCPIIALRSIGTVKTPTRAVRRTTRGWNSSKPTLTLSPSTSLHRKLAKAMNAIQITTAIAERRRPMPKEETKVRGRVCDSSDMRVMYRWIGMYTFFR